MRAFPVALLTLVAFAPVAGCAPARQPAAEDYVPHGRFAALPLAQALRECRLELESAGRQSPQSASPRELRQIPPPLASPPQRFQSMQACMEAKGYRRGAKE